MRPRTTPDPEDRTLLRDKHPNYSAGWNKVKHAGSIYTGRTSVDKVKRKKSRETDQEHNP